MNNQERWKATLDIVTASKRMWQRGFVANHDGNLSVRLGDELLATPTAVSKADITPETILTLDLNGKHLAGPGKPFSEINLHVAAYKARPDITAVAHAHPPYATARGAAGLALDKPFIPESIVSIGNIVPVASYTMPGTLESAKAVTDILSHANVFMIAGNGVLAVGADIMQAYLRIELVEHLAKMDFIARQLGSSLGMPTEDIGILLEKRASAGLDPASPKAAHKPNTSEHEDIRKIIAEEIKSILGT
ncbi:MAG: class II aldolase/adducin family protein [Deltaproteobacteria bacterium]|nr:class II aldolase/adducin family protein [Deltaproteobacteria bacterium]MBI2342268.1 class II aldolase/adducin family protein [Deltaproteobacteria bacterium]